MRAKRIFFIILICILTASVTLIGGCVDDIESLFFDNKYNATLYDKAIDFDWFTEDYLADKLINNCYYDRLSIWNNVVRYSDEETDEVHTIEGYTFPTEIIKTIETQEEFDNAFKEFPDTVDFENQFLVVYFFRTLHAIYINGNRERIFRIRSTELENDELSINIYSRSTKIKWKSKNTMRPSRRAIIIKMDKIEFSTVNCSIT